jgi:hypothetical protein
MTGLSACTPERYTEAFYPEGDIREVVILGDAGDVVVEAGDRLRVERTIRGAERALSLSHSVEDGALVLESRCQGLLPCSVDVRLQLSEGVPVFVILESGEVLIREMDQIDVELSRGQVLLEDAGDLRIRLGQGDVRGTVKDGTQVEVVVAEGNVEMRLPSGPWSTEIEGDIQEVQGLEEHESSENELTVVAHGGEVRLQSRSELARR